MNRYAHIMLLVGILLALLLGLPLLGVHLAGQPVGKYLEFPPLTRYVEHAPFSWPVFTFFLLLLIGMPLPFVIRYFRRAPDSRVRPVSAFPRWGWLGLACGGIAWVLAWNRFPWFSSFQPHTFSLLWFSYILVINGLCYRQSGRCMMINRTRYFIVLFFVSAAFWWFFEYLNRFVQNWYYIGVEDYTGLQYFVRATLPFSTVLPAVLGTCEYLQARSRRGAALESLRPIRFHDSKPFSVCLFVTACAGLVGIGIRPNLFFPLLWLAPLLILVSLEALLGRTTVVADIETGNWRRICLLALAALICGCFWEMWNFHSQAKWEYAVPYVYRFCVFEMPLVGYAGYLPFGIECALVGDLVAELVEGGSARDGRRSQGARARVP